MPKAEDLTGKVFGKWTVLHRVDNGRSGDSRWMCTCSCGTTLNRPVKSYSLRSGHSASCGCIQKLGESPGFVDLTGKTFGRWLVIDRAANDKSGAAVWNCKCDCEREFTGKVSGYHLRRGKSKSCGCLQEVSRFNSARKDRLGKFITSPGYRGRKAVLNGYKKSAAERGLVWGITDDEFFSVASKSCRYCDQPPSNCSRKSSGDNLARSAYFYSGIDRVDNSVGYVAGNCVPCCWRCNRAKVTDSLNDWISYLDRVASFRTKGSIQSRRKTEVCESGQMSLLGVADS